MITPFIKKYNGMRISDAGGYVSADFKKFQSAMKREVKRLAEGIGATLVSFSSGHYDMSWFIERDGKCVYGHYSRLGYRSIPDLTSESACYVRTAESPKDYRGGTNHHCTFEDIQEVMNKLLK